MIKNKKNLKKLGDAFLQTLRLSKAKLTIKGDGAFLKPRKNANELMCCELKTKEQIQVGHLFKNRMLFSIVHQPDGIRFLTSWDDLERNFQNQKLNMKYEK